MTMLAFTNGDAAYLDDIRRRIVALGQPETVLAELPLLLMECQQTRPSEKLVTDAAVPCQALVADMDDLMRAYLGQKSPGRYKTDQLRPRIRDLEHFAHCPAEDATDAQRQELHLGHMILLARRAAVLTADARGFKNWTPDFNFECTNLRDPLQAALLYVTEQTRQIGVLEVARLRGLSGRDVFQLIESERPVYHERDNSMRLRPI